MKILLFVLGLALLQASSVKTQEKHDKVFCLMLVPGEHRGNLHIANGTYSAWAHRCNHTVVAGFYIREDKNKKWNFTTWRLENDIERGGAVEALNRTVTEFGSEFQKKAYDWIFVSMDLTFVLMDNLRDFLSPLNVNKLLYFGKDTGYNGTFDVKNYSYMDVKPGFVISWPAVEKFVRIVRELEKPTKMQPRWHANCTKFAYREFETIGSCMKNLTVETVNTHYFKNEVQYPKFWNVEVERPPVSLLEHNATSISFYLRDSVDLRYLSDRFNRLLRKP